MNNFLKKDLIDNWADQLIDQEIKKRRDKESKKLKK